MRIDKLLWFLRLIKTRSQAQSLVAEGHIRLNSRRVERIAQDIGPGDILVLPLPRGVTTIEVLSLPQRRGPRPEAQSCYRVLDGCAANLIATQQRATFEGTTPP